MKWWKAVILAVLSLGVVSITVGGLRSRPPASTAVQLTRVRRGAVSRTVTGAGKVQASTTVKISSNLSGDLVELAVKNGDRVRKGQLLARIDPKRFEAAAKQMAASHSAAESDVQVARVEVQRALAELTRVDQLRAKGLSADAEVDKARADHDTAVAREKSARERLAQAAAAYDESSANLGHTVLLSPMDGTVIELDHEVGERLRGSDFSEDTLMVVAALSVMEVQIEVGEHEIVYLRTGQEADVSVDALDGQSFKGSVLELAQRATVKNPGTESEVTTFPVKVALTSRPPGVLPGMSAEVHVVTDTHRDVLTVPIQSVTVRPERSLTDAHLAVEAGPTPARRGGETLAKVVFIADGDGRVHLRRVQTGIGSDTDVEILDGIKEGERVVEGPFRAISKELQDGAFVKEPPPSSVASGSGAHS